MDDYYVAYAVMRDEYMRVFADPDLADKLNPSKRTINLRHDDGVPTKVRYEMEGESLSGATVYKCITIDDKTHGTSELFIETADDVRTTWVDKSITAFRCGVMTAVIIDVMKRHIPDLRTDKIGFIGCGKTNLQNAKAVKSVFGTRAAVIRGSRKCRGKNRGEFETVFNDVAVDDNNDMPLLNECDIVVSCTSGSDETDMVSANVLAKPRLLIALDTGWLLDESFRKTCDSYSDYVHQQELHYSDEFAFDKCKYDLGNIITTKMRRDRACVYVYGIAFADAVIGELIMRGYIHVENIR